MCLAVLMPGSWSALERGKFLLLGVSLLRAGGHARPLLALVLVWEPAVLTELGCAVFSRCCQIPGVLSTHAARTQDSV